MWAHTGDLRVGTGIGPGATSLVMGQPPPGNGGMFRVRQIPQPIKKIQQCARTVQDSVLLCSQGTARFCTVHILGRTPLPNTLFPSVSVSNGSPPRTGICFLRERAPTSDHGHGIRTCVRHPACLRAYLRLFTPTLACPCSTHAHILSFSLSSCSRKDISTKLFLCRWKIPTGNTAFHFALGLWSSPWSPSSLTSSLSLTLVGCPSTNHLPITSIETLIATMSTRAYQGSTTRHVGVFCSSCVLRTFPSVSLQDPRPPLLVPARCHAASQFLPGFLAFPSKAVSPSRVWSAQHL